MPRGAVGCLDDSHALSPLSSNSPFKPLSHRSATLSSEPPRGILIRRHHPMTQGAVEQQLAAQASSTSTPTTYVYFFGGGASDGNGRMKDVLGGKGAGLAEMTSAGLPVPPGFTIQTEACREFMRG